jgi:hypothetical protein
LDTSWTLFLFQGTGKSALDRRFFSDGSWRVKHFKNAAATALELGHHDSRITFAHYRELVKPKEAERYWNIQPAKTEKIVALSANA